MPGQGSGRFWNRSDRRQGGKVARCPASLPLCLLASYLLQTARGTGPIGPVETSPLEPDPVHTGGGRSEEHTSELQSQSNLVCRLLLEKKKKKKKNTNKKKKKQI